MSTTNEIRADLEAVCRALAEKRPVDPHVAKRVRERSAELRREFDSELSVELIRSIRKE
jgi:hypothetical protein